MNVYDDETLCAYVDGELDGPAREAFEHAMSTDADLARRVEAQRRLRLALGAAFDPALSEPVPEALLHAARGSGGVRDTVVPMKPAKTRAAHWRAPQWLAIAASLVAGILIGRQGLGPQAADTLVAAAPDGPVATGALATALSRQLAADHGGPVRIGLSYRATSGEYCRTFEIAGDTAAQAGVACRDRDAWHIRILEATVPQTREGAELRQATSSGLPDGVRRAVESSIAGDVLDATSEAAARDAGWH